MRRASSGDVVLQLAQLGRGARRRARDRPARRDRRRRCRPRARTRRSRTSRAAACSTNAQQLVVIGLGLARVADDEVRAERGVGPAGADVVDAAQEPVAVAPPAHPAQQRLRHVLQREVEVRAPAAADHVDQTVGEVRGIQVEEADPRDRRGDASRRAARSSPRPGRRRPCRTTRGPARRARSPARRAGSTSARIDSGVRLRCGPRKRGDRAEAARAVAALGDLHVRPRRRRRRPGQVEQVELGHGVPTGLRRRA